MSIESIMVLAAKMRRMQRIARIDAFFLRLGALLRVGGDSPSSSRTLNPHSPCFFRYQFL
jgi:hypothetical protein